MNLKNINTAALGKKVATPAAKFVYVFFRYALLIGVSYLAIFPIIKMLSASLSEAESYYMGGADFIPRIPTFKNFIESQQYFKFFRHAKVTLMMTIPSTILSVFVCSLIGYGIGRYKFKGRAIVYACVLFTIIMPITTVQLPLIHYYRWFDVFGIGKLVGLVTGQDWTIDMLNSMMRFYVPAALGVGLRAGIFIFLFQSFFAGMPRDLEEAAKIDGCSPFKIYLKVMIPNIIPVVVTVTLLSVIYYWNDSLIVDMAKLNAGTALMPQIESLVDLKIGASSMTIMQRNVEYYSILITAVTPLVVVFIFGQRFFVECMDRSGSKG